MSGWLHVPAALPPGKKPGTHLTVGEPESRYGRSGEDKESLNSDGTRTPDRSARNVGTAMHTIWCKNRGRHRRSLGADGRKML
jgi:hypothetical protein